MAQIRIHYAYECIYIHADRNTLFMGLDDGMTRTDVVALSIIQQQRSRREQKKLDIILKTLPHITSSQSVSQSANYQPKAMMPFKDS